MAGEKNVVIVPGLFGSQLALKLKNGTYRNVWIDQTALKSFGVGILQLNDDGRTPGPLANGMELVVQPGIYAWMPYVGLSQRLRADGWNVSFFAYDWRRDLIGHAEDLADYLIERFPAQDFYLCCHSMGGLIARMAYPQWNRMNTASHWIRSLYIATPQYGSGSAGLALASPLADQVLPSGTIAKYINPWEAGKAAALWLNIRNQLPSVVASFPSVYQLLPSILGDWDKREPSNEYLWDATHYTRYNGAVKQKWFAQAAVVRAAIDATLTVARPSERQIAGKDIVTSGGFISGKPLNTADSFADDDGDGVVTLERLELANAPVSLTLDPTPHSELPSDPRVLSRVTDLLLEPDYAALSVQPAIPPTPPVDAPNPMVTIVVAATPTIGYQRRDDP